MHTVNLIAEAARRSGVKQSCNSEMGLCCLTGVTCETVSRKELISKSFTQQSIFNAPNSQRISVDVDLAFQFPPERHTCWFVTESEFSTLENKQKIRDVILNRKYPAGWWAGWITTSYKKHGSLLAPANYAQNSVIWGHDDYQVNLTDHQLFLSFYDRMLDAKKRGLGNTVLETLEPDAKLIAQVTLKYWLEFSAWAKQHNKASLYRFCLYLLPSAKELEACDDK